jgi:hypothetical protein
VAEQLIEAPYICILDKDGKLTHVENFFTKIMNGSKGNEASEILELEKKKNNLDIFRPILNHTMDSLIKIYNSYFTSKGFDNEVQTSFGQIVSRVSILQDAIKKQIANCKKNYRNQPHLHNHN